MPSTLPRLPVGTGAADEGDPSRGDPPGRWSTGHRPGTGPRRRALLAGATGIAAAAGLAAGCTDDGEADAGRRREAAHRLRRAAARDSETLLTRYDGTAAAHPALSEFLAPLRRAVAEHVEAFGAPRGGREGRRDRRDDPRSGPGVPSDEKRALSALADAERRTAADRTRALVAAPPELSRLLASVAASGAAHAFLLTEGPA